MIAVAFGHSNWRVCEEALKLVEFSLVMDQDVLADDDLDDGADGSLEGYETDDNVSILSGGESIKSQRRQKRSPLTVEEASHLVRSMAPLLVEVPLQLKMSTIRTMAILQHAMRHCGDPHFSVASEAP